MQGLVKVLALVAKQVFITTDDGFLAQLDMEVPLLLVAEADAVLARFLLLFGGALRNHVDLLIDLIILLKDVLLSRVKPRL